MKKFIILIVVLITIFPSVILANTYNNSNIPLYVRGEYIESKAILKDNRTFVSVSVISELLGHQIELKKENKVIDIKYGTKNLHMQKMV